MSINIAYKQAKCKRCGDTFKYYPSQSSGTYCSRECRKEDLNVNVVCFTCGKEYTLYKSLTAESRGMEHNYCSSVCYKAYQETLNVAVICQHCGETFKVWKTRYERGEVKFCSRKCEIASGHRRAMAIKNNPRDRTEVTCLVCGNKFEEVQSRIDKNSRFCSTVCYGIWRKESGIASGEGNPMYRDGSTGRTHSRTRSKEWKMVADRIRVSQGNRCAVCERDGGKTKLPVHHKIPWEVSHDDSPENLMVVCQPCHVRLDNAYFHHGIIPF